jgi:hypothetical protein
MENPKMFEGSLEETAIRKFSPMNVMIIKKEKASVPAGKPYSKSLGIPDFQFAHREGMITKAEVRAIALSKLRPDSGNIMWDIGAGSGSVSIEAEGLIAPGKVFAIEKDQTTLVPQEKHREIRGQPGRADKRGMPQEHSSHCGRISSSSAAAAGITDILAYVDTRLKRAAGSW